MSVTPQRRNPLRLIVQRENQLHILWRVGGVVFFTLGLSLILTAFSQNWFWNTVLLVVIGAAASLWTSRSIAGPLYRIEKDLETILQEKLQGRMIHLRHGDPLQHLVALINQLVERQEKHDK